MQEFMVTFGVKYAREKHPVFAEAHPDGWVTIEAADYEAARAFVVRWLGSAWAFLYPAGDFDASYHPTGELRRVRADEQHIVYAFASGSFGSLGDEAWIAIADDGEVVVRCASMVGSLVRVPRFVEHVSGKCDSVSSGLQREGSRYERQL